MRFKRKILFLSVLVIGIIGYFVFKGEKLPTYTAYQGEYLDIEKDVLEAFITVQDSAVIELPEGYFIFSQSLILEGRKQIVIKGQGMDKTILSFKGQKQGAEGIKIANCENVILESFTVEDANGDNIKVTDTNGITFRRIRTAWTGKVSVENGAYGIYPVLCKNVLIEECEAIAASDAGIYVGQSDQVIIRNNKAFYNVAGIESENSTNVEIYGNEAFQNTGGLLIFDLPGLTMYGGAIKAYDNHIHDNNLENFAVKGSIVGEVPKGSGVIILATKKVDFFENTIENHKNANLAVVSYEIFAREEESLDVATPNEEVAVVSDGIRMQEANYKKHKGYDAFPGMISIHKNQFKNKYWFPAIGSDYGKLWTLKNGMNIPDIAYDGIFPENYYEVDGSINPEYQICVFDNGNASFALLDAANDFENFTNDLGVLDCSSIF